MVELPTFIDFETSNLGSGSYLIEVAWNFPDGSIEAHLISPTGIEHWTDWSVAAAKIHGIKRAALVENGKPPSWVCHRMNRKLAGKIVYSDNPDYDVMWLGELRTARKNFTHGASPLLRKIELRT